MGVSRIRLSIDQLVLKGFEPGDRNALVEGLQAELSRVLADPAMRVEGARSHRTPVLRLGRMPFESGPSAARKFGSRVAQAIGKEVKPLRRTPLPRREAAISIAEHGVHEREAEQTAGHILSGGTLGNPIRLSPSPIALQRQTAGTDSCRDVQGCAHRLLAALEKNDGTEVSVVLSEMAQDSDPAGLRRLAVGLEFRQQLRKLAPGSTLFTILRRLWFPKGAPAAVQQFEEALRSRNGALALRAVQQFPDLRDPAKVPGTCEAVNKVFTGAPEYAGLMSLLSWKVEEVLQMGRQSARFRALEAAAQREARHSGEDLHIGKGDPGDTETRAGYVLIQPDVKSPQDAVIRLAHELANKAAEPDFERIRERRNNGEFKSATEYAEAILSVEADSVIQRAEVAVELNITENPTVEALIRDMRAHKIGRDKVYDSVLADIKARYKGPGGVPAMQAYEQQFRDSQQSTHH